MTERVHVLELRSVRGTGGGPEKTILLGARRAGPGVTVTVCYIRDRSDAEFGIGQRAAELGVDYIEIAERGPFDPRVWSQLRRIVRERGIDIVHAHDYKTDLLALLLSWSDGIVPLATAHGWTGHSPRERAVYYPVDKLVMRSFPITIAVSGEIRSELIRRGAHPERVRVVLNGIDPGAFRRQPGLERKARAELGMGPDDLVVGAIGRLEPQKRFDLLIEACARVKERRPSLRLLIAGAGSLRTELDALAARKLPGYACRLLSHRPDVAFMHHAFDLFVQSSDYEGTPNAVLEAMALETPIVATAAGGTTDILQDGVEGTIVPCGNVDALAAAIDRALGDREGLAQQVRHARARVETRLSFDERVAAVERIYFELAGARQGRAGRRVSEQCA